MGRLIIVACLLRLVLLGSVPPSLNWDEVSQGYTAYSIMQTGRDEWGAKLPIFFRSYGEWKSAVYIYLLVPFIKVLGLNVYSIRLPSAICGIISVYLMYLLGKKLSGDKVGLWSAFLMSVTPWTFILGRPAFEANVALTIILAGTYLFLQHRLIFSAILFGLAPHTYNSAKVFVPLLVLYLLWSLRRNLKLKPTLIFLSILAIFAFPILANLTSGHSLARFNQVGVATDLKKLNSFVDNRLTFPLPPAANKLLFNRYTYTLYGTASNYLSYFNPSFLTITGGDHAQHHLPYHGVLYLSEFALVLLGISSLLRKQPQPRGASDLSFRWLPLVIIALGILPAALTRDSYHVLRSLLAAPGFVLLAAIGISYLQNISSPYLSLVHWSLAIEIILLMGMYFFWYPVAYARDWQYGHAQVAKYLQIHAGEYDHIVMTKWYGEPQLFLAFYNRWDPLVYQQQNLPLLRYESEGRLWLDQLAEYSLGKYTFKYLDWDTESRDPRTLYIGKGDDFLPDSNIKQTILFPDGTVAFHLVQGDK